MRFCANGLRQCDILTHWTASGCTLGYISLYEQRRDEFEQLIEGVPRYSFAGMDQFDHSLGGLVSDGKGKGRYVPGLGR
jgi:hypothetical protein